LRTSYRTIALSVPVARQDSWQGPFLAGLTIEESDRHGETAGVPG
jgi:hypothetical protein